MKRFGNRYFDQAQHKFQIKFGITVLLFIVSILQMQSQSYQPKMDSLKYNSPFPILLENHPDFNHSKFILSWHWSGMKPLTTALFSQKNRTIHIGQDFEADSIIRLKYPNNAKMIMNADGFNPNTSYNNSFCIGDKVSMIYEQTYIELIVLILFNYKLK